MHNFSELIRHSTEFSINALNIAQQSAIESLQTSAATLSVKTLQAVHLQKAITAIGMFSMFDAILQEQLQCSNGFQRAAELLEDQGETALKEQFCDLQRAVNVLKHGRGRSYNALIQKASSLSFRVKLPGEVFFNEGDVAEVSTLIEVDDQFMRLCAQTIYSVAVSINLADQDSA